LKFSVTISAAQLARSTDGESKDQAVCFFNKKSPGVSRGTATSCEGGESEVEKRQSACRPELKGMGKKQKTKKFAMTRQVVKNEEDLEKTERSGVGKTKKGKFSFGGDEREEN